MEPAHPTLGSLLRDLRGRKNWTLKEMSVRTGIPLSTLSKIEHNRLTLSYDKLQKLSQSLNIHISELFSTPPPSNDAPVTALRSVGTLSSALRIETANYDHYYMCPEISRKLMVPITVRVRSRTLEEFGPLVSHPGEEYIQVLEGKIDVHTEFYQPVTLSVGESIYLGSSMGHAYLTAEGSDDALILAVCVSTDEGLVESLMTMHESHSDTAPVRPPLAAVAAPQKVTERSSRVATKAARTRSRSGA